MRNDHDKYGSPGRGFCTTRAANRLATGLVFAFTLTAGTLWPVQPAEAAQEREVALSDEGRAGRAGSFAIGIGLGEPTALELAWWLTDDQWLSGGIGTGWASPFLLHANWHIALVRIRPQGVPMTIPVHVGIGALAGVGAAWNPWWGTHSTFRAGVRFPIGVDFWFDELPFSLFVEIAPQITTRLYRDFIGGQIGGRFHLF